MIEKKEALDAIFTAFDKFMDDSSDFLTKKVIAELLGKVENFVQFLNKNEDKFSGKDIQNTWKLLLKSGNLDKAKSGLFNSLVGLDEGVRDEIPLAILFNLFSKVFN